MNQNDPIIEVVNKKLIRNSNFEFIDELKDLTLSDIDYIEKFSNIKNIKSKFTYQIVDNIYIKITFQYNNEV